MEKSFSKLAVITALDVFLGVMGLGVVSCNSRQEQAAEATTIQPEINVQAEIDNRIAIPPNRTAQRRHLAEEFAREKERRIDLYRSGWEDLVKTKALGAILQLPEGQGNETTQKLVSEIVQKNVDEWQPAARNHTKTFINLIGRIRSEYPDDSVLQELIGKLPVEVELDSLPDPKENNAEAIKQWASTHLNDFYKWLDPLEADLSAVENRLITNIGP